jgi:hypothetical protein
MAVSLRTYRALTRELAKTKKELSKKTRNDLEFKKMVFTAKKKYDRELKVTRDEIDIFRKSLKNWNKGFYTQRKEIKKLKSYIRRQKLKKKLKKQLKKRKMGQVSV